MLSIDELFAATPLIQQAIAVLTLLATILPVVKAVRRAAQGEGLMDLLPSVALVGLVLVLAGNLGSTNVELRAAVFRSSVTQALQSWDCSTLEHSRTSLRQGHQLLLDSRHRLPRLARSAEQLAREHPWDVDLAERGTSLYDEQEQHIFSACAAMRELLDQAWQLTAEPAAEAR